jgi:diguanylate cyclase (GGDEF)-like protein
VDKTLGAANRPRWLIHAYLAAVSIVGLVILVHVAATTPDRNLLAAGSRLWVLLAFALFGELVPLTIARGDEENALPTSPAFVIAILLIWGPFPALFIAAVASMAGDLAKHKAWDRVFFNAGQYVVAFSAASWILNVQGYHASLAEPLSALRPGELAIAVSGGLGYFLVNDLAVGAALALHDGTSLLREVTSDFMYQLSATSALLALAPVVAMAAIQSPWFVVLMAVPICAVYRTGSLSVENEHMSLHDSLTGLPNRKLLQARAAHALDEAVREERSAAVFLIDLDRFKDVNDTLGHHVGDELLQQVGVRLAEAVRPGDTVARLGGDEFGILLPDIRDTSVAEDIAERIRKALGVPFSLHGLTFDLQGSIGIALCPEHGSDIDVLMQRADVAMYIAKETRARWERYSVERDRNSPARLGLLGELRRALDDGDLVVHYQPKADLRTGRIVGAEALVRWEHTLRGLVFPDEFIPMAEQSGLIKSITLCVLDLSLQQAAKWQDEGLDLELAVNVSVRDLHDVRFPQQVAAALKLHGVPPAKLSLEITEGVVMADAERVIRTLEALDVLGVQLSLDDFGAGYSSLTYLKRLPVSEIKIDKSFVLRMDVDDDDSRIVRSTIDLAQGMGLRVVAEGVETALTWKRLTRLGCDIAQGYFLSRPLAAEELLTFVRAHTMVNDARAAG